MNRGYLLLRQWPLALGWGALASAAVLFTRFDGGIAFLWGAAALLFAALVRTARRHWWAPLTAVGVTSFLVSGSIGIGWAAALPFVVINLSEPVIAALILRRRRDSGELLASLPWFWRFIVAATVAPILVSPIAGGVLALMGRDPWSTMVNFIFGHALGNLTLTPIAFLLVGRSARHEFVELLVRKRGEFALVLPMVAATCALVFWQDRWPLLFLPVMVMVLATFRLGRSGAAVSLTLLAVIGGAATTLGSGPIALSGAPLAERLLFFQFFLAASVLTILPVASDLHHRHKLHRRLKTSEAEFRMLAEYSTDAIMRMRMDGRIVYVSPSIEQLTGYRPDELVGERSRILVDPRDFERVVAEHRACLEAGTDSTTYSYRCRTRAGDVRWLETHARAIRPDAAEDRPTELLAIIRDVTEAKAREAELTDAAMTDRLTGLPNRRALEQAVAKRRSVPSAVGDCLALFDLDRFKLVNDTYGHDAGDAVLKGFAEIARQIVRSNDQVVRLGGEEFVVLFANTSIDQAYQVCDRLRRVLAGTPIATPAGPIRVTVSGGVAVIGGRGLEPALKAADQALYRAKRGGRDQLSLAA